VLQYVRGGLSYGQIARGRRVSRDAVKQHAASIRDKLGLESRADLERWLGQPRENREGVQRREAMPVNRIEVLLNVADVERSLSFYRDLLGMQVDASWADDDGRVRWAKLIGPSGGAMMLNQPSEGDTLQDRASRPGYRDAVIYVQLENVEELMAAHRRLADAGARPGERHEEMYGVHEFLVRDPDGYELGIIAPIGS
jgi:catechol 2,3-dioxygenase-like lactoylglutathione lyase family enzyme